MVFAVLLLAYPLSLGPVLRYQLHHNGQVWRSITNGRIIFYPKFYEPLAWLGGNVPYVQKAMSWYVDLWDDHYWPVKGGI